MNTYPAELVAQLPPCMLASGLVHRRDPRAEPAGALRNVRAPVDVFPELAAALAAAHEKNVRLRLWQPPARQRFRVVLVAHGHRVPPAKVLARARTDDAQRALAALPPRSPLSPLHPGGPLFPDGIISPSWIRKHIEYMPAVYVAYVCLGEPADDERLAAAFLQLRQALAPRGTRVVAALVCRAAHDATDARMAALRRAAQLDARTGLFVLTPTTDADAFCALLDTTLLDEAREYYWERSWRVRRNRARYPPPPSVAQPIAAAATAAGLFGAHSVFLTPEGWNVRTLYKLAVFAELQGNMNDALAMYAEAYAQLVSTCLANTSVLSPRTRRWAEAKVLADTLSFKVCKYHLYRGDPAATVAQFRRHTRRLTELSAGWGIGTSTSEFWAWLAKQLQLMGDLTSAGGGADVGAAAAAPSPTTILAPAGIYYYLAALATLERAAKSGALADHVAAASENFGCAYDGLRRAGRPRHALLAAVRIGLVYLATGAPERAMRFLERALRAYRDDGYAVPHAFLAAAAAPAMLARGDAAGARMQLEARRVPHVHAERPSAESIEVHAVFAKEYAHVGDAVPFQVRVCAPPELAVQRLTLHAGATLVDLLPGDDAWAMHEAVHVGAAVRVHVALHRAVVTGALVSDAACTLALSTGVAQVLVDNTVHDVAVAVRGEPVWAAARVGGRAVRIGLPHLADARHVSFRYAPRLDVAIAHSALCGETVPLHVQLHDAPPCDVLVALSDTSRAAGTRFTHTDDAYIIASGGAVSVALHAPQAPASISLLVRALAPSGGAPVLLAEHEHRMRVHAPFDVRAALHWAPARPGVLRSGHITMHVRQTADCAFALHNVHVHPAAGSVVRAHAPLALDELCGEWAPADTGVVFVPLHAEADAEADAEAPPTPQLRLSWQRADGPPSCTRIALVPLEPAPPSEVAIDVVGPVRAAVDTPFPLYIRVHNHSAARAADVHVELSYVPDDYLIAGPTHRIVEALAPGEARTLTVRLVPRTVAPAVQLPRVYAWENAMQGGLPVETPVPVTGRPAALHVVVPVP